MPTLSKRSARGRSRGRGQSLVEFALVFPVFILILAGILDFGFMLYSRMTVINAAREGARAAVLADNVLLDMQTAVQTAVIATSNGLTLSLQTLGCVPKAGQPACDWDALTTPTPRDPAAGDSIVVTVTNAYQSSFPLLFGTTFNLSSTVQMVLE